MPYELGDTDPKPIPDKETAENPQWQVAAACDYVNKFRCPGGGTATPAQVPALEKDPRYVKPEGPLPPGAHAGDKNPYAADSNPLSITTNTYKTTFDSEKIYKGNLETNLIADYRNRTAQKNPGNYALLSEAATAAGEATLGRGSQVQSFPSVDITDPSYPRYVLEDKGNYDLGSNALDYLYTGATALKDLRVQPGVDQKPIDTQEKRVQWDIDTVLNTPHDMDKILDDLSGPIYKDYGNRFQDWKESCIDKYNHPETHIYDSEALDGSMIAKYQSKAARDVALIDMAMVKNNVGNKTELVAQINDYLKRAAEGDSDNADLKALQRIAKSL